MYEDLTYENIVDSMLDRVSNNVDKREGSVIFDAVAPVAYSLSNLYFTLDNYGDLIFPDTSLGEYLDRFSLPFNITRKESVKAVKEGVFDMDVPVGSRFTTSGEDYSIFTVKSKIGQDSENHYVCEMECESAGEAGNIYVGKLIPIDYMDGLTIAEVGKVILEGMDEETDEEFRKRLLAKMQRPSTSGNANDYYNWAMEYPGVGAVKVFPLSYGPGTVKLVIADEEKAAVSPELIKNVTNHINEVRPIGADITVVSAVEKKIDITANVLLSKTSSLGVVQSTFSDCIEEFLKENAFKTKTISLARIGNLLMGITGVEDYVHLTMNGLAENMVIKEEEVAVNGTVRLEMMQNE